MTSANVREPLWVRWLLILAALAILSVLILLPVIHVFVQAFSQGVTAYWQQLTQDADTRHALLLTATIAPVVVTMNLIFGIAASWAIARFRFPGRSLLITLIGLPFSVSPVVSGLAFILLLNAQSLIGGWLLANGYRIIFATPALVLVTAFVSFPFIARELIPLLEAVGSDEELAALSLGASGWQMFWRVTLPNIKWGVLHGIVLCNARAMGEFGAVYVVSGRIAGQTDTLPLRVEKLFQEYQSPAAFALASTLTLLAFVTLLLKYSFEQSQHQTQKPRGTQP
jgi:sulfate/thiosulfate transport system permease protein